MCMSLLSIQRINISKRFCLCFRVRYTTPIYVVPVNVLLSLDPTNRWLDAYVVMHGIRCNYEVFVLSNQRPSNLPHFSDINSQRLIGLFPAIETGFGNIDSKRKLERDLLEWELHTLA